MSRMNVFELFLEVGQHNFHIIYRHGYIIEYGGVSISPGLIADFSHTNIYHSRHIRYLSIIDNPMIRPMYEINNMRSLIDLTLSGVGRIAFEGFDMLPLERLTVLDISNNQLLYPPILPRSLTKLNISHNNIAIIDNLANLSNLVKLDISHNNLERLTVNIMAVILSLKKVNFTGNRLLMNDVFTIVRLN